MTDEQPHMTPERWQRIDALFHAALQRPADERAAFLSDACADDDALRREVESLLSESDASAFLETPAAALAAVAPNDLMELAMEGQVVSHYRILERLGGGGMGVVYKAQDERLKRLVALKFLPPDLTRDDEARQRFMQEAQAASALDHPNICTIHEIDTTPDGRLFLAMACYEGETLKRRIRARSVALRRGDRDRDTDRAGPREGSRRRHRAPRYQAGQLILTKDGTVKIVDFGIAKLSGATELTRTGVSLGTIAYMSPEQLSGRSPSIIGPTCGHSGWCCFRP